MPETKTAALWDFAALVQAAGGTADGAPSRAVTGFSIDTRSLAPGEVFVALKDQRDGHAFVTAAFERGAAAALVAESYVRQPGDGALVRVADTLTGLRGIAAAARARLAPEARVIAVTGSAGKTGTTAMLRACLATCGKVHAPEKSFNNHWGVPLTLARMPADTRFAVIEIGMSHADEIRPLTTLARPHIAIVTNVLPVHVGNFPDGEIGVANAKAEIFEGLEAPPSSGTASDPIASSLRTTSDRGQTHGSDPIAEASLSPSPRVRGEGWGEGQQAYTAPAAAPHPDPLPIRSAMGRGETGGIAIILRDSPHFERLKAAAERCGAKVQSFGIDGPADARILAVRTIASQATEPLDEIGAELQDGSATRALTYRLGVPGRHIATNALAVLLAVQATGCLSAATLGPLADLRPVPGRGSRALLGAPDAQVLLIDEAYNANPASMRAALGNLLQVPSSAWRRRLAVLGDMLELGDEAAAYHRDLAADAARADLVFACGPMMAHLFDALPGDRRGAWAPSSAELVSEVLKVLRAGDAVMVKGSFGSRMGPIVEAINKRFAAPPTNL